MPLVMIPMTMPCIENLHYLRHMWNKINWLHNCKNTQGGQMCGRTLLKLIPVLVDQLLRKPGIT